MMQFQRRDVRLPHPAHPANNPCQNTSMEEFMHKAPVLIVLRYAFLAGLLLLPAFAGAEESGEVRSFIGASYLPRVSWGFPSSDMDNNLKITYKMDATSYSSYEANVRVEKLELSLGVNALLEDGPAGDVDKLVGYIGIKNIFIRASQGKIRGTANWPGSLAPGMTRSFTYENSIKSYDILYLLDEKKPLPDGESMGWYVGFGYTKFDAPVEIATLVTTGGRENQEYGVPVFEKNYSIEAYSFLFGFDTLMASMSLGKMKPGDIGVFLNLHLRLGFGSGTVSDDTVKFAEALNPGKTFVDSKQLVVLIANDSTMGFYWSPKVFSGHGVVALGYNYAMLFVGSLDGAAKSSADLGYDVGRVGISDAVSAYFYSFHEWLIPCT